MDLAEQVFRTCRSFPKTEEHRLTAQLIRATISVPANIAEEHARATRKDYARFVSIARGSLAEAETLLLLAERMELTEPARIHAMLELAEQVGRMLNRLHLRLEQPPRPNP